MRQEDVREFLERRPFQPFRIHLSTGAFFDIRQPRMASVGRSTLAIALPLEGTVQRFAMVSLLHVVWVEVLVPVA
jgi:hypothetical protein